MPNDDTMNNYVFDPALSEIEIQEIKQKAANNITFLNTDPKPYALSVGFLAGAGVVAGGCISYYTSSYDFNRNLDIAFGAVVWAAAGGVIGVVTNNVCKRRVLVKDRMNTNEEAQGTEMEILEKNNSEKINTEMEMLDDNEGVFVQNKGTKNNRFGFGSNIDITNAVFNTQNDRHYEEMRYSKNVPLESFKNIISTSNQNISYQRS